MQPGDMRAQAALRLPSGTAMDGIGVLGLVLIRSSPATEFSTILSAGASILPGLHLVLRTLGLATDTVATLTIALAQAIIPPTILAAGRQRSLDTRVA